MQAGAGAAAAAKGWRLPGEAGLLLATLLLVGVLSLLPLGRLVVAALAPGGELDLTRFLDTLQRPSAVGATWRTLETAALGAVGALVIAVPFALLTGLTDLPGRRPLALLLLLPLMIAPQVTALAWLETYGPASPLLNLVGLAPPPGSRNPLLGRDGIAILYAVQNAPVVFLTLRAGLARVPRDLVEAARIVGARPWFVVLSVVLPLIRPYLLAAVVLAFVAGIGNFGIPALLGLPVNYTTLPTLIYQRLASSGPRALPDAAALSVLVGLITLAGIGVQAAVLGRKTTVTAGVPASLSLGRWGLAVSALLWAVIAVALLLPVAALVASSLLPTYGVPLSLATITLDNYVEVLWRQGATVRAFRNSFLLSAGAALLLAGLALVAARTLDRLPRPLARIIDGLAELPYALPGIVLAIAAILVFLRPLPIINVSIYATPWIILFAYLARFLPLVLKPVTAALHQLPRSYEEAAAVCGATLGQRLVHILAPLALPAAAAGALMAFMSAFNELTVSALLWSAGSETLGVVLFNLKDGGYGTLAAAIAVSTLVVALALMLLLDRLGRRLPPGVIPWR